MGKKKQAKSNTHQRPEHWDVKTECQINGRNVVVGTELSITGESGRFRFVEHVTNTKTKSEWITVVGPLQVGASTRALQPMTRSFKPARVKRVHWKDKTRDSEDKAS